MPRSSWPPYQTVRPLIHSQVGRMAVIQGGGPTLDAGMALCPGEALYLSVNDHGCKYFLRHPEHPARASYIVACDKIEPRVRLHKLPVFSRHMWADYRILYMPAPSSGMAAAWVARMLGCAPIVILGMDCFSGATYADDPKARSTGHNIPPRVHLQRWRKFAKEFPAQYRVIGCHPELAQILGAYVAGEPAAAPVEREQLETDLRGVRVRITRPGTAVSMRDFEPGTELELGRAEAEAIIKQRKGMRL